MRNFRRDIKAISPVLAVLMMIAVAVAGSLVTYAWVMGYIGFTQSKAGRAIMVQSMANSAVEVPCDLVVYVQNVGEGTVTFDPAGCTYVDGGLEPAVITVPGAEPNLLQPDETATIVIADKGALPGQRVRVRVVTHGGTFMEATDYPGETVAGPGVTPPPTVTRVQANDAGFGSATADNFLVAIAGHRSNMPGANHAPTITSDTGWTLQEVAYYQSGTSVYDRRIVAIFTKIADGGEDTVTIDWGDGSTAVFTLYQEFEGATSYVKVPGGSGANSDGVQPTSSTSTRVYATSPLVVPTSALSDPGGENILSIAAMVWRDTSPYVSSVSFTGLSDVVDDLGGSCPGASAFNYGSAVTQTTVSWTPSSSDMVSGLLIQFACSS